MLCFTYFVFSQLHFYRWYSYWSNLFRRSIYLNVRLRPRHWLIFINEPKNLQREGLYNTVQSGRWVKSGLLVPKVVFHPIYYDNTTRSLNKHYLRHFICPKTVISMLFEFHLLTSYFPQISKTLLKLWGRKCLSRFVYILAAIDDLIIILVNSGTWFLEYLLYLNNLLIN